MLIFFFVTGMNALLLKFLQKNSPHNVQTNGGEGEGAQWARRPDNEKRKINNIVLKNSGREPKTQAMLQGDPRYQKKFC